MIKTELGFKRAYREALGALGAMSCSGDLVRVNTAKGYKCCPVTLVCLHRTGSFYGTGQYLQAAWACGIDKGLAGEVAGAADGWGEGKKLREWMHNE